MKSFKQFIKEYLTPEEHQSFSHIKMTPHARSLTDHFFGKDNDEVKEDVPGLDQDKSEVHKKIENYLKLPISVEHYRSGHFINENGNKVRIGRVLRDKTLLKSFNEDSTRRGGRSSSSYTSRVVRGTEVAGQTHPTHSWNKASCKNLVNGSERQHLPDEIAHGTIVHFIHGSDGKEIYRATLQPHDGPSGRVYTINSEYGLKHPAFQAHAHDIAKRLSTATDKHGLFTIHPDVYNDSHLDDTLHPDIDKSSLDELSFHKDPKIRAAVASSRLASTAHISKALGDKREIVRSAAIRNPNATNYHLQKALNDPHYLVRAFAVKHPKMDHKLLMKALDDPSTLVRQYALENSNIKEDHLEKALDHADRNLKLSAIHHPKMNKQLLMKALDNSDDMIREEALKHKLIDHEHLDHALSDKAYSIKEKARKLKEKLKNK